MVRWHNTDYAVLNAEIQTFKHFKLNINIDNNGILCIIYE